VQRADTALQGAKGKRLSRIDLIRFLPPIEKVGLGDSRRTHVSIAEMFKLLLPLECPNGWLGMLRPYLDDSGTHEQSDIVVVAGIIGTEGPMDCLDRNWRRHLDRPLCGTKEPLRRFHMTDCDNHLGEFERWSRTESDYFCHQLRKEIIESGVTAFGIACSRKDYDDLVTGDIRGALGSPEGFCIHQCFVRSIGCVKWPPCAGPRAS
jgi:hypothetical protein